ncbi:DNA polymerase III subunit beta [Parvularcula lutaonensis]|uniref:DNA polymerase III subunit beta n=1 Tax=Parvularcula lutaonensis TaxID=491923 RepID=UPI0016728B47|nr:DNA polymerase III subunit beta [Parvularcula lutaonensis]GGY49918.1 DNA polymerase III subunit beta [Parvularcula lutaonensis]
MKVTIERGTLLKALSHVQSVVERRNTIPILSNVLLRADGGTLSLTATDLDIEIVEHVPADVEQPGAATAAAVTLFDIVKKLPDGTQVQLEKTSMGRLQLTAGHSEFSLAVLPEDDFPVLPQAEGGKSFEVPAEDLSRLIDKARFAMSQEETRYYLNGIYMHASEEGGEKTLRAVATDGHRLARIDADLPQGAEGLEGIIIPRKAVLELRRLLDDAGETVEMQVSSGRVRFAFDDIALTTKLIDGTFPDYARVIPQGNDKLMRVSPAEFAKSVDRVSTVSADKTRSVKLALEGDTLRLNVNSPETGTATEDLGVDYPGEPIEIGFNARYLLDITSQIDGDTMTFAFADTASPTLITDEADERALYVLMPLRV